MIPDMSKYEIDARHKELGRMVGRAPLHSPLVRHILNMYSQGHILTKEEALALMVVELVKANEQISLQVTRVTSVWMVRIKY